MESSTASTWSCHGEAAVPLIGHLKENPKWKNYALTFSSSSCL